MTHLEIIHNSTSPTTRETFTSQTIQLLTQSITFFGVSSHFYLYYLFSISKKTCRSVEKYESGCVQEGSVVAVFAYSKV